MRWIGLAFVIIAVLSLWLFFSGNTPLQTSSQALPDGFMVDAHYIQYDDQGQVHMILNTSRMIHFAENSTSYFTQPHILAYTKNRIPWTITAEEGNSIHDSEQVNFYKNVVIHQAPQPDYPETTITTSAMTIYPHRAYAETDQPVVIIRPDTHIDAIGMQADFKFGLFKLLSSVRGTYVPAPQNQQKKP